MIYLLWIVLAVAVILLAVRLNAYLVKRKEVKRAAYWQAIKDAESAHRRIVYGSKVSA